ncbi:MAG: SixA phosphatase family protein [Streptosporangiaceae bacterium]
MLVRHAEAAGPGVPDHDRPLARRGRRDAPAVGRWLRDAHCVPDQVLCSTARRARETWQLAAVALGAAVPVIFDHDIYDASPAGLIGIIRGAPAAAGTVVVVGHAVLEVSGPWSQLGPGRARLTGFVTPGEMGTGGTGMRVS